MTVVAVALYRLAQETPCGGRSDTQHSRYHAVSHGESYAWVGTSPRMRRPKREILWQKIQINLISAFALSTSDARHPTFMLKHPDKSEPVNCTGHMFPGYHQVFTAYTTHGPHQPEKSTNETPRLLFKCSSKHRQASWDAPRSIRTKTHV
jgi:hypothetical protein